MKKSFIKIKSYIGGIITVLIIYTMSLSLGIYCISEYDIYTYIVFLILFLIVYIPGFISLLFLFNYRIHFDNTGIYTTIFNKRKKWITNYEQIKKVEIYVSRGLRINLYKENNDIINLEYNKKIIFLLRDCCNEHIKEYITKYIEKM